MLQRGSPEGRSVKSLFGSFGNFSDFDLAKKKRKKEGNIRYLLLFFSVIHPVLAYKSRQESFWANLGYILTIKLQLRVI